MLPIWKAPSFLHIALLAVLALFALRYLTFSPLSTSSTATLPQPSALVGQQQYDVCIVSRVHNVASMLPQWLEYHNYLGVGHFLLADDCSDDFDDLDFQQFAFPLNATRQISRTMFWLRIYEQLGVVTVFQNLPFNPCHLQETQDGSIVNISMPRIPNEGNLLSFLSRQAMELGCQYIAALDVDEYVSPTNGGIAPVRNSLYTYLLKQGDHSAVLKMPWYMMSSQHRETIPKDLLMIEAYTKGRWDDKRHVKMFVSQFLIRDWRNPHYPFLRRDLDDIDMSLIQSWEHPFLMDTEMTVNASGGIKMKKNWKTFANPSPLRKNNEEEASCVMPTTDWYVRHFYLKSWEEFQYHRVRYPYHAGGVANHWHQSPDPRAAWEDTANQESSCPQMQPAFVTAMARIVHQQLSNRATQLNRDEVNILHRMDSSLCLNNTINNDTVLQHRFPQSVQMQDLLHAKRLAILNCTP